jgi:uncharacterized membrane protein
VFNLADTFIAAGQTAIVVEPSVYALTTVAGNLGLSGRAQLAFGLVLGGGFGLAGYVAQLGWPGDFAGWFALVIFTLLAAIIPTGVYEGQKNAAAKGAAAAG